MLERFSCLCEVFLDYWTFQQECPARSEQEVHFSFPQCWTTQEIWKVLQGALRQRFSLFLLLTHIFSTSLHIIFTYSSSYFSYRPWCVRPFAFHWDKPMTSSLQLRGLADNLAVVLPGYVYSLTLESFSQHDSFLLKLHSLGICWSPFPETSLPQPLSVTQTDSKSL